MEEMKPFMPPTERDFVKDAYEDARVILEYGSGGSTLMAARMPDKVIISVESDPDWAEKVRAQIEAAGCPSPAIVHHVDIGPTGPWGLPKSGAAWRNFQRYSMSVWDEPFFQQPDVILIDGRFRAACLMAAVLRTKRRVTVLFDDYTVRPAYRTVERLLGRPRTIGRLAVFQIVPGMVTMSDMPEVIEHFFRGRLLGEREATYQTQPSDTAQGDAKAK